MQRPPRGKLRQPAKRNRHQAQQAPCRRALRPVRPTPSRTQPHLLPQLSGAAQQATTSPPGPPVPTTPLPRLRQRSSGSRPAPLQTLRRRLDRARQRESPRAQGRPARSGPLPELRRAAPGTRQAHLQTVPGQPQPLRPEDGSALRPPPLLPAMRSSHPAKTPTSMLRLLCKPGRQRHAQAPGGWTMQAMRHQHRLPGPTPLPTLPRRQQCPPPRQSRKICGGRRLLPLQGPRPVARPCRVRFVPRQQECAAPRPLPPHGRRSTLAGPLHHLRQTPRSPGIRQLRGLP